MSMIHKIGSAALAVALLAGISSNVEAAEWKGWNIHKPGYPNTVAMDKFAELLVGRLAWRVRWAREARSLCGCPWNTA